jgi:basic amino acid/polyamine antiporter, APA family
MTRGSPSSTSELSRVLGVPGAVLLGLGSIVGTGIFVTIGTVAGIAGSWLLVAIVLAAFVATCNGLSSAQLAAAHPVSGGAYEYGHKYLSPWAGRIAGATFVCAKTASAATAALGFSGYVLAIVKHEGRTAQIALAMVVVVILTVLVAGGMKRSNRTNAILVVTTLVALVIFVVALLPHARAANLSLGDAAPGDLLHATALVFVAYTGYGRIATLGEEVREPARTIPRAMIITLAATALIYVVVSATALGAVGGDVLAGATRATNAPLEAIAPSYAVRVVVALGAATAMLGVIVNLLLGISRVVLAMARRKDLPSGLGHVEHGSPRRAVIVTGIAIAGLALVGNVATTWTLSAFTVLLYYAVMNLCALRQPAAERRFPRAVSIAGLAFCVGLAVWLGYRGLSV